MATNGHTHCWHMVGRTTFNPHGPHAPASCRGDRTVMRCCHCASHQATDSMAEVPVETITFDEGCSPHTAGPVLPPPLKVEF